MENRDAYLARYMVGRYRLGHEKLALYIAGILFEKLIYKKLRDIQKVSDQINKNLKLSDRIEKLKMSTLQNDTLYIKRDVFKYFIENRGADAVRNKFNFTDDMNNNIWQLKRRLHNFRWLRNQVMHGNIDEMPDEKDNKKDDMINYIWREFAPVSFDKTYKHWRQGEKRLIETMKEHTADYLIRDIDEVDIKPNDWKTPYSKKEPLKLTAADFENMYELRRKLLPLKNFLYFGNWLKKNAPSLSTDILTTIDTTSGYIWMPLTRMKENPDGSRSGILSCSVSILATPLDLRVYIDFGGMAYNERKLYFDFLSDSEEYDNFINSLEDKSCLKVFDIDWYSNIFNELPYSKWINIKNSLLNKAVEKLNKHDQNSGEPITWNRSLHGYIFNKLDLGNKDTITFKMIEPQLINIIKLFEAFSLYAEKRGK